NPFVLLPLHSHRPTKILLLTKTPSFQSSACASMSTQTHHVRDTIELTEVEQKIFDRLLATQLHFKLKTDIRVAGGWVRDKLLGKDSNDIDIALDHMMGKEFADKVREYSLYLKEDAPSVCVIESDAEKSKHLETATMRLFGISIDFVNLRSEKYKKECNIPEQTFGTAEEDAYRRDLTINSLFYNINNGAVEDFTKRGISDLKSGKIVTPLPPKATFLDDPLRVLRAIRMVGAILDFTLDEDLKGAAACDDVKNDLTVYKISKERIGKEVDLMITGNQPVKAMTYICELTLFQTVFTLPEHELVISDECERLCISYLDNASKLIHLLGESTFTVEQRRLALYAALFLPLRNNTYKKKAKKIPVVNRIILESLKFKAKDAETVLDLHRLSYQFLSLIPYLASGEDMQASNLDWMGDLIDVPVSSRARVITGFLLIELRDFWRVVLLISILLHPIDTENEHSQLEKRRYLFNAVENSIMKLGLEKVWDVKPLINGKDVMKVLQLKGGPLVKEWLDKTMAWQLANPSGTSKKCIEWLEEANSKRVKLE
ncbi:tRNA nucleotidyltransferase cca2, partial [Medicago truncatula]|uniref:tRNA nucleotidyltransferase cca2 n=1 Tax=Medicago truncatula TaxID=3880 RepID=UPI000D2F4504